MENSIPAFGFQVVDHSLLKSGYGNGAISEAGEVEAGILSVQVLVEADALTSVETFVGEGA